MENDTNNLNDHTMTGEEIVVTGMSGIFPNSNSVQEFMENLYNKVDMVGENPIWSMKDPEVPKYSGKINGMEKFDSQFFKVGYQQAKVQDPMSRKLLEHAYGAIFDSGNTQVTLKGKAIGVFIGSSCSDTSLNNLFYIRAHSENIVSGSSKSMLANRISYWVNGVGPSYCLDYSCVSSTAAIEKAYQSIKNGDCDAAVVGGCNHCIYASVSLNFKRVGLLCQDGKTKCFDKSGDGYVRSDAITVIFLQKSKDAKRVYAEVVHTEGLYQLKDNDQFMPLRKTNDLQNFLKGVYCKSGVDPKDVEYVEANGAGLAEADENEVEAISNVFFGTNVVKLGSVKSNMGHSEGASGLCSLTKLCLAYHKGEIPANLHLKDPVESAKNGKVQIVTENAKFNRGYTAINNFSFSGASYHVILKGHYKKKNLDKYKCKIPRIVLASGRTDPCVNKMFDALKIKQVDAEEIALLHNIFENDMIGHTSRGFTVLDTIGDKTEALSGNVDHYTGVKPPLWFVFSGMGSQWAGMGADLLRIPTFAAAIERCQTILQPYGVDVIKAITDPDNKIFDKIFNAFVGIGAVQVGLIDIIKEMGIVPDYIIGHSLGEMACAYHDNTFTIEQMMLATLSRSKAIENVPLIKGAMAAVGVGYKNLVKQCPPEVDIGCHNSSESSTISGPADIVEKFVGELTNRKIFARSVPSGNVAYHSRYIAEAGPLLQRYLKEVLKNPKLRSEKWISTSVPKDRWDDPAAKYSSADYHVNNLLNPVLFEEMARSIPHNAVVVEIAPHGLLQAILKRSHKSCTHIPLTRRGNKDGVKFLLDAIGQLYTVGFNPKVDILYPKVSFPVSTETPLLSQLVEWEHSENWSLITYTDMKKVTSSSRKIVFSLHDEDYKFLSHYFRNGVNVLPEAALLAFVWETLAMYQEIDFRDLSVVFQDIQFHREIILTAETPVRLTVMISKGSDTFELTEENKLVMSGKVTATNVLNLINAKDNNDDVSDESKDDIKLTAEDIYTIFKMRGYDYRGKFQTIISANSDRTKSLIKWTENWIPFLDSLIQFNMVSQNNNGVLKPKLIRKLHINTEEHKNGINEIANGYDAQINKTYGVTWCAGLYIKDITYTDVTLNENMANVLKTRDFFHFHSMDKINMTTALNMSFQIIAENSNLKDVLITKFVAGTSPEEFNTLDELVNETFMVNALINISRVDNDSILTFMKNNQDKTNVILTEKLLQNPKRLKTLQNIPKDSFILSVEDKSPNMQSLENHFTVLSCISDGKKNMVLMKRQDLSKENTSYIPFHYDDSFSWVSNLYNKLKTTERVVLISENQQYCGVLGLVKTLKAKGYSNISVIMVDDCNAPKFDPVNELYKKQLQKKITINILRNGQWGSFYYKKCETIMNEKSFTNLSLIPENVEKNASVKVFGDKTLVQVCYSGLSIDDWHNNTDTMKIKNTLFGMDFSGVDIYGVKTMGLIADSSAADTIEVDPELTWPVPDHWTLEDAATVPLAYTTAYYCLAIRCNVRKGKTIMISDGSSCIGLALISLCLSMGNTVYTVVNNEEKKTMLLKLYPGLNENNIICCDNDDFYYKLLLITKERGCDYVIFNSATGTNREDAFKCVGSFGFFLDMSKPDLYNNKTFGMSFLVSERSYVTVDVLNIFKPRYSKEKQVLHKYMTQGIESGVVKPLSRVSLSPLEVDKAFKVLSLNEHTGKILIRIRDPSVKNTGLTTISRIIYSPQDVLIIVCDEKGIAIELADWLIERGARNIILHIESNSISGYIHTKCLKWKKQNVSIIFLSENLKTKEGSATFLKNAMKLGTVTGVFIVSDQKHSNNETKEDFINANKKSKVVMNLDMATRNCVKLRQFVVLSHLSQNVSDEYALSLTEQVCDMRTQMGFPALLMQYESLLMLEDMESNINKARPQSLPALFNSLETSIKLNYKNVLSFDVKKEENDDKESPENQNGIYQFYKHVDTEENDVISQAIIEIPTLLNNGFSNWDPNDSYIILIPGFEGRSQIFETMAERLKIKAMSVQLMPDLQGKCIEEIALHARQQLNKRSLIDEHGGRFSILGYLFGVNIALELAAILEREGKTGVVHCIDSSPDALRANLDDVFDTFSESQLQNHVLNHMYNLITGTTGTELEKDLRAFDTFEAKVEECIRRMIGVVNYTNQYKRHVLESAYNRIMMAQHYQPQFKLRSQLVLMKSSKYHTGSKLADDYNLSKYSYEPVKVYPLLADNPEKTLNDCRVSNIVNLYVDAKTLDKYKKMNLCDIYDTAIIAE